MASLGRDELRASHVDTCTFPPTALRFLPLPRSTL